MATTRQRRGAGEGSVYRQQRTRSDGTVVVYWEAKIEAGRDPATGKRLRRKVQAPTKKEALRRADKVRTDLQNRVSADSRMTVSEWMQRYLDTVVAGRVNDEKTVEGYERMLRVHIKPGLGSVKLADLTAEQIDDFLASRSHLAKTYVGRIRSFLVNGLEHAVKRNKVRRNEASLSVMPKCKQKVERVPMTPKQIAALEKASVGERLEALFLVAFDSGLRPGEMTGITWPDLNLAGDPPTLSMSGAIHLKPRLRPAAEVKDGESRYKGYEVVRGKVKKSTNPNRTIELSPKAVEALKSHKARQAEERLKLGGDLWHDHGLVFCSEVGTPIDPGNLRRTFDRIAAKAEVGHVFPYAIRHTTASLLIDNGASIEEVADLFGDDPVTLYRHYRHRVKQVAAAGTRMRALLERDGSADGSVADA